MATAVAPNPNQDLIAGLDQFFYEADDGFWYPKAEGTALVRVEVDAMNYRVWRRRSPDVVWTLLVETRVEDFNIQSFTTWANTWQLTI
jgi:hypothetical protein